MTKKLKNPPPVDRLRTSGRSSLGKIDPTAGRYGAGLIPGVSLCSRGEALGHYSWIDAVMLAQIVEQCNANPKLIKSRFAHPDMCDDGTGKALGTIENASLRGDQAIGDLHLYRTAHNAPDGDLAGYVMQLAAEDPSNFGLSIVFEHDWEAEELFEAENTQETELKDDKGNVAATEVQFVSPDPLNTENLPHARIKRLWAADVVDDPAANPAGLFHRKSDLLTDGTALLDYAIGRTTTPPKLTTFSIAPERVREFLTRYLAAAGLSLHGKDQSMKLKKLDSENPDEDPKPEENPDDQPTDEKPVDEKQTDKPEENDGDPEDPNKDEEDDPQEEDPKKDEPMSAAQKLKKFVARFGAENGSKWTIEGITYTKALERHCDQLTAQLADADARLQALGQSGTDPVKFSHPPGQSKGTTKQPSDKLNEVCGEGLARIAAAIRLPGSN